MAIGGAVSIILIQKEDENLIIQAEKGGREPFFVSGVKRNERKGGGRHEPALSAACLRAARALRLFPAYRRDAPHGGGAPPRRGAGGDAGGGGLRAADGAA